MMGKLNNTAIGSPKVRTAVNQLFLALSSASALTGFNGLSFASFCFTQVVPFELAIAIGFGLSTVYVIGSAISGLEIYLDFRDSRKRKKVATKGERPPTPPVVVGKA
jgi:predicted RND superfamily exporter protein